jgi:hypothetical protein
MHTRTHAYKHSCIHGYIYAYMNPWSYIYIYRHACADAGIRAYIHACKHTCIHAFTHICLHTFLRDASICIRTHTHIYVIFIFEYPYLCIYPCIILCIYLCIYICIYLCTYLFDSIYCLFILSRALFDLALQLSTARGLAAQLPLSLPTRLVKTSGRCHGFTESVGWNMLKSCHPALLQLFLIDSANTGSPLDSLDHEPTWEVDPLHVILCVLSTLEDQTEF